MSCGAIDDAAQCPAIACDDLMMTFCAANALMATYRCLFLADALSRYPVFQPEPEDCKDVLACTVLARRATEPQEDLAMNMIKEYVKEDQEYNKIYEAVVGI